MEDPILPPSLPPTLLPTSSSSPGSRKTDTVAKTGSVASSSFTDESVASVIPAAGSVASPLPPTGDLLPKVPQSFLLQAPETSSAAKEQKQEPGPQDSLQTSSLKSNLDAYKSYRDALNSSSKNSLNIFTCTECSYPFRFQEELNNHIKRHNILHCNKCNNIFSSKNDLKFHIKYESNCERQWNCKECGYQGNSQTMLKTHIEEKHTDKEDTTFSCTM